MKIVRHGETFVIACSAGEVALLSSCTNETLEALEDWEFETRVGVAKSAVEEVRSELNQMLRD